MIPHEEDKRFIADFIKLRMVQDLVDQGSFEEARNEASKMTDGETKGCRGRKLGRGIDARRWKRQSTIPL